MFLTSYNATAQVKLLLGPDRCLRIEPYGKSANIEMDDYDSAFAILPKLAMRDFETNRHSIARYFKKTVEPREKYYSTEKN